MPKLWHTLLKKQEPPMTETTSTAPNDEQFPITTPADEVAAHH